MSDAERSVLAAMILSADSIPKARAVLSEKNFSTLAGQRLFRAIDQLSREGHPVDLVTLSAQLKRMGDLEAVGGTQFLSMILDAAVTSANVDAHARMVEEASRHRDMKQMALVLLGDLDQGWAPDEVQERLKKMAELAEIKARRGPKRLSEIYAEMHAVGSPPRVPLGLEKLSTLDIVAGDLCVIGARTGCGKTSMLTTLAANAAAGGWNVLLLSLEMHGHAIGKRLELAGTPGDCRVWIEDDPILTTIEAIAAYTRAFTHLNADRNCVVIVDYLQLVKTRARFEKRHEAIGHVCRELKLLARACEVPMIVAAQLSRAAETRGKDSRPQLSDLRESGEIEQTADQVLLLQRLETGTLCIVPKYRMGARFTTELYFDASRTVFEDHAWQ